MIREKLIFKLPQPQGALEPPTFSEIFGANYYEDWDFNDLTTITLNSGLVEDITSKGLNGGVFSQPAASSRPTSSYNGVIEKYYAAFDGVADHLTIPSSAANYKFMHNGAGGCLIVVRDKTDSGISTFDRLINNMTGNTTTGFFLQEFDTTGTSYNSRYITGNSSGAFQTSANNTTLTDYGTVNSIVVSIDSDNATNAERAEYYYNGILAAQNTLTGTAATSNSTNNMTMAKRADSGGANYWYGNIYRVIIADVVPDATQLTQIEQRLDYEYGNLPI